MSTYDWSGVSVAYNRTPPNYSSGEQISLSVSGDVVKTDDGGTVTETMTVTANVMSSDGVTYSVPAQPVQVTRSVPGGSSSLPVSLVSVSDSSGRVWNVSADGKSATTTA